MKAMMMVAVLVLLVVPVAVSAQNPVLQGENPNCRVYGTGSSTLTLEWEPHPSTATITCPSPSIYSFAVELRRIIEAREQKLKALRELLVELEKGWVGQDNTITFSIRPEGCTNCITFRDAPDLVIDKTLEYDPKQ